MEEKEKELLTLDELNAQLKTTTEEESKELMTLDELNAQLGTTIEKEEKEVIEQEYEEPKELLTDYLEDVDVKNISGYENIFDIDSIEKKKEKEQGLRMDFKESLVEKQIQKDIEEKPWKGFQPAGITESSSKHIYDEEQRKEREVEVYKNRLINFDAKFEGTSRFYEEELPVEVESKSVAA